MKRFVRVSLLLLMGSAITSAIFFYREHVKSIVHTVDVMEATVLYQGLYLRELASGCKESEYKEYLKYHEQAISIYGGTVTRASNEILGGAIDFVEFYGQKVQDARSSLEVTKDIHENCG